jgi:hypothetical protein
MEIQVVEVPIVGLAPVIMHRFSATGAPGESKTPDEEAAALSYWLDSRPAMPSAAFKAAMLDACQVLNKGLRYAVRDAIVVAGKGQDGLVPLTGTVTLREDSVRVPNGRRYRTYRYQVDAWTATLCVHHVLSRIDVGSVAALIDAAGCFGGVGAGRPGLGHHRFGTWRVATIAGKEAAS